MDEIRKGGTPGYRFWLTYTTDGLNLVEELALLRRQVREQEKEICRLKEENEFFEQELFSLPAVGSLQKVENDVSRHKNRGRRDKGNDFFLLTDAESHASGIL